jgi:hypothetical protein
MCGYSWTTDNKYTRKDTNKWEGNVDAEAEKKAK